jgi:dissimilatory sulfite reductase (desulfoviridin) alpha/beta subunit
VKIIPTGAIHFFIIHPIKYVMMQKDLGVHMKGGVITEINAERCTVRTRIPAGKTTPEQLEGLVHIAREFGAATLHLTTRQTIEIPHLNPADLDRLSRALAANGTPIGSEKDEVVNIIACPGLERCKYANVNTIELARKIDERVFGKEMPVKMRIAIAGCPNGCTSPMLNEIGIIGRNTPIRTPGLCNGCGTCALYCKEGAVSIKNGISILDPEKCVECGVCIASCPFNLIKSEGPHYLILVGGRRGRHPQLGKELIKLGSEEKVIETVERIIQWVYRRAWSGRFLCDQLDELQFDKFKKEISG